MVSIDSDSGDAIPASQQKTQSNYWIWASITTLVVFGILTAYAAPIVQQQLLLKSIQQSKEQIVFDSKIDSKKLPAELRILITVSERSGNRSGFTVYTLRKGLWLWNDHPHGFASNTGYNLQGVTVVSSSTNSTLIKIYFFPFDPASLEEYSAFREIGCLNVKIMKKFNDFVTVKEKNSPPVKFDKVFR